MTNWTWRKSRQSATTGGQCVEVGTRPDMPLIGIRDSKLGDASPILTFTRGEIAAFLTGVKAGEFDDLA